MPHYRLYKLDSRQKIDSSTEFSFASDDEAIAEAYSIAAGGSGVEVWSERRMVARVPHLIPSNAANKVFASQKKP